MCDPHVIETVKRRMLSRRDLFRASAAGAAAVAVGGGLTARPVLAQPASRVIDLTHTLRPDFPTYFGTPQYSAEQIFNFAEHGFNLKELSINEHTGTHIDAPLHFAADGMSIDEIPVEQLVCPLVVVDIREKAAADADAQVTPEDLRAWIAAHGPIPGGACVAQLSGWQERVMGDGFRNADEDGVMHFPGFHVEAVQMLLEEADVAGVGVDTLSIDFGPSADFITHYTWLPEGRWALEAMANLDQLPPTGATLVVGAPKHQGGTGGPARLIALL